VLTYHHACCERSTASSGVAGASFSSCSRSPLIQPFQATRIGPTIHTARSANRQRHMRRVEPSINLVTGQVHIHRHTRRQKRAQAYWQDAHSPRTGQRVSGVPASHCRHWRITFMLGIARKTRNARSTGAWSDPLGDRWECATGCTPRLPAKSPRGRTRSSEDKEGRRKGLESLTAGARPVQMGARCSRTPTQMYAQRGCRENLPKESTRMVCALSTRFSPFIRNCSVSATCTPV
jgi:hypothetical protein